MKENSIKRALPITFLTACLAIVLGLSACSSNDSASTEKATSKEPKFAVQLYIGCVPNLIFSKYDVDVKVDNEKVGNIDHGGEATFELNLTKGQHELVLNEEGATEPDGKTSFVVEKEGDKFSYKINCTSDQIEIQSIMDESEEQAEAEKRAQEEEEKLKQQKEAEKQKRQEEADRLRQEEEKKQAEEAAKLKKEQEEAAKKVEEAKKAEEEKAKASNSKYEFACVRRMNAYDLYYLIDFDDMTATNFSTEESPMVLPCSGDLENGLTIKYENDGFTEKLKYKSQGSDSKLVLIDGNGFDWEYEKTDVAEAEKVLASVS